MLEQPKIAQLAPQVTHLTLPARTLPPFNHVNSYLVHDGGVGVLIDPGFSDEVSFKLLQQALAPLELAAIVLTHSHNDHSDGVELLQRHNPELPVYLHPLELPRLAHANLLPLEDGQTLTVGGLTLQAIFTPGHSPGHLSYYLPELKLAFAGDLIAGQGSTWVGHPEGDIGNYLASVERLAALPLRMLAPGHGPPVTAPQARLNEARQHRLERLAQVVAQLSEPRTLSELRARVYPELPEQMAWFAERSLLALLIKLMADGQVARLGEDEAGPYALMAR